MRNKLLFIPITLLLLSSCNNSKKDDTKTGEFEIFNVDDPIENTVKEKKILIETLV